MDLRFRITKEDKKQIIDFLLTPEVQNELERYKETRRRFALVDMVRDELGITISKSFARSLLISDIEKIHLLDGTYEYDCIKQNPLVTL